DRMNSLLFNQSQNTAMRLIHAESDGLPGLIVDRYADWLVAQFLSAGVERRKAEIVDALIKISGIRNIYERSDVDVRALEGLPEVSGLLFGEEPPREIEIVENGLRFLVDIRGGHKTGFYLDQRDNRAAVGQYAKERRVLNCFSYTGGFAVYCLAGGAAQVISIDSSPDVLEIGRRNLQLNQLPAEKADWICADVFQELRALRDRNERFDLIILDPPKFAPTIGQVQAAARGYKDINLLAFKLLNPGGMLATFSCSGGVERTLFQKIVADAALDAGVHAQVIAHLSQAADHPVALNFPEGEYLKGLICQAN
ncbi:MAG: class I SAM-dependent rRNA methyltransferase, partial [Chloroflexota bacterium]